MKRSRSEKVARAQESRILQQFPALPSTCGEVLISRKKEGTRPLQRGAAKALKEPTNGHSSKMHEILFKREKDKDGKASPGKSKLPPLEGAFKKVHDAMKARRFQKRDLRGFEGPPMARDEFKARFAFHLNVRLSPKETLALVSHIDSNGDELVDYDDVCRLFCGKAGLK